MAIVRGGPVLDHVQAFADDVVKACGLASDNPGTYPTHQPTRERALDIFVTNNEAGRVKGENVCAFALANWHRAGVRYVIFRGPEKGIWHRNDQRWVRQADRSKPGMTAAERVSVNHYDHVHISFEPTAPEVTPSPTQEDDLKPEERQWLADTAADSRSTNEAVGRLEIAVRDQTTGLVEKVDTLIEKVDELIRAINGGQPT